MADGLSVKIDMREFNRAMQDVLRLNKKSAKDDLYYQGKRLLPKIVRATSILTKSVRRFVWDEDQKKWVPAITKKSHKSKMFKPKTSGRLRAGWVLAWTALGLKNVPRGTGLAVKIFKGSEGDFVDKTKTADASIELINRVSYIDDIEGQVELIQKAVNEHKKTLTNYVLRKTMQRLNKRFRKY